MQNKMSFNGIIRSGISNNFVRIASLQIITKGIGFLREVLIARLFGVSQYADAYVIAQNVFNLFSPLISDAAQTAGTPILSRLHTQSKMHHLHISSVLISWAVIFAAVFSILVGILAEPLLKLITPGLTEDVKLIVRNYIWLLLPYGIVFAASGAFTAAINSQERYGFSELGNLIINVVSLIVLGTLYYFFPRLCLPLSLSVGFIFGAIYYFRAIRPHITLDLFNDTTLSIFRILPTIMTGYGLIQANIIVDRYFASTLPEGTFAAINYANKIVFLPISIVGASINTIAFVRFSNTKAGTDSTKILIKTFSTVLLSLLPFTIVLSFFSENVIRLFFNGGAFDIRAIEVTSKALHVLAFALPAIGLAGTLQKKLYADKLPAAVLRGTAVAVLLGITTNFLAVPQLGIEGLMLAICVSNWGLVIYLMCEIFKERRNAES